MADTSHSKDETTGAQLQMQPSYRSAGAGERRTLTILFSDVKGSTAMAENLDPEEWAEIMNEAFKYLIAPIERFGGTVARLMGDGLLAFFGAPVAHEDDPRRAVLAGLAIQQELRPFCEQIQAEYGLAFNVRVGINTGPVVVGEIGSDLVGEYTAMGDAVNLASRMEQTAEPGTVQITEATLRFIEPFFEIESLASVEVKGKSHGVKAYRVLNAKDAPGSLRGLEGIRSPLVGREKELDVLLGGLDDLELGRGGLIIILGEAGLGKTRLIEELKGDWLGRGHPAEAWRETRGVSYDSNRPYSLFVDWVRQYLGVEDGDSPEVVARKITQVIKAERSEHNSLRAHALESLLPVSSTSENGGYDPEAVKDERKAFFRQTLEQDFSKDPAVMVFDDLHWADPISLEALTDLFQLTDRLPILFLCALRPHRKSPGWRVKVQGETDYPHRYREIKLAPLSEVQSGTLLENLLSVSDLPEALQVLILRKAEGNPLFVEEVIRTLIEQGTIELSDGQFVMDANQTIEAITLPDNVQALLTARIDRLETDVRRTLQLAAVVGREFPLKVLEQVTDDPEKLTTHMSVLQRVELLIEKVRQPELKYSFTHELTRDAAYETILKRERRVFHRRVAEVMEQLYPDRLEQEADRLARHYDQAGDQEKAIQYYIMAGDSAARLYANKEAIVSFEHALFLGADEGLSDEQLLHIHTRMGRAYELLDQFEQALDVYERLESVAQERGNSRLQIEALLSQATLYSTPTFLSDYEKGLKLGRRVLEVARLGKDYRAEAKALWNLALLEGFVNYNHAGAIEYGEQSLAIAREHDLIEQIAYAQHDLGRAYFNMGMLDEAVAATKEAQQLWEQLGNKAMLADILTSQGTVYHIKGDSQRALELVDQGFQIYQSIGNTWGQLYNRYTSGMILVDLGDLGAAIQVMRWGIVREDLVKFNAFWIGVGNLMLAWAYCLLGAYEDGLIFAAEAESRTPYPGKAMRASIHYWMKDHVSAGELMEDVLEHFDEIRKYSQVGVAIVLAIMGEILLENRDLDRVLSLISETIIDLQSSQSTLFIHDLLLIQGRVLLRKGKTEDARLVLQKAQKRALKTGSRRVLMGIYATLAELERARGDLDKAQENKTKAFEILNYIAENAGSPELKDSFLKTPIAKRIVG